jgi:branched-chain amino acid transport system substrate-binding protein
MALLLIASTLLGVSGCQSALGKSETYKIGALVAVTGKASSLGLRERDTLEMLAKQANEAGGLKGPDGKLHPVELVLYDTESEETKAVMAAKKLINEDQVLVIIGPTTSGESLAIVDTVQRDEVPMISMASSKMISEPVEERKWVFKVTWNDTLTVGKMCEWLKAHGVNSIGWLSVSNGFGDSGLSEFERLASQHGLEVTAIEKMMPGDTDMTAQLTKIKGTNPDSLVIYATNPELAIATKNAYDLGFDIPIVAEGGASHPMFIELATKEAVEGVLSFGGKYSFSDQLPDTDPQKAVINRYKEVFYQEFEVEPDHFGAHAWDAWHAAVQAIEKAGGDRAAIRDALEETDFVGTSGIFKMSPTDHAGMALESIAGGRIVDGVYTLIED